jgi:hypothetical protein
MDGINPQHYIDILTRLNLDYPSSDQNSNVARYEEILSDDFMASMPDLKLYSRKEFLDMIARPRPFTDLHVYDIHIRLLGGFALIHARITFKTHDGVIHDGRYTDDWQRQNGKWLCVAANVIAKNI